MSYEGKLRSSALLGASSVEMLVSLFARPCLAVSQHLAVDTEKWQQ
jgi:hypothetical protein